MRKGNSLVSMKSNTGFSQDKDIYLLWGRGEKLFPSSASERRCKFTSSLLQKQYSQRFLRIKVRIVVIGSSSHKGSTSKTAPHTQTLGNFILDEQQQQKRMMILCSEILKFISLSNELVSLSLGMN